MSGKKKSIAKTDAAFYAQVRDVFVQARQFVHKTANFAMVKAYWLVGKMIVEKQGGEAKATHGDGPINDLSMKLTEEFGAGFTRVNLFNMRRFYLAFPKVYTLDFVGRDPERGGILVWFLVDFGRYRDFEGGENGVRLGEVLLGRGDQAAFRSFSCGGASTPGGMGSCRRTGNGDVAPPGFRSFS